MNADTRHHKRPRVMMLGLRGIPDVQGGVEKHVEQLAPLLVDLGCDVEVLARGPYVPPEASTWRGVAVRPLWAPRSRQFEAIAHTALGIAGAAWRRPDLVHIHAIGPALMTPLARLLGLRVLVTHHGFDYDRAKWGRLAKAALRAGENLGMKFAHGRIAVSHAIAASVKQRFGAPIVAIPNGVAVPAHTASTEALRVFGLESRRYVLSVGRLVPEKRHLDLIDAFSRAAPAEWKLAIVGGSDHPDAYSRTLEAAARQAPNVVMTGLQKGEALAQLYAHAGLFALPSSHEGLPIALLEALSHGLPALASDIPANLELALEPHRYFPTGDVNALADRLRTLCAAPFGEDERAALRARIARDYSHHETARRTLAVYRQVLGLADDRDGALVSRPSLP